jgi:hypothetical protein
LSQQIDWRIGFFSVSLTFRTAENKNPPRTIDLCAYAKKKVFNGHVRRFLLNIASLTWKLHLDKKKKFPDKALGVAKWRPNTVLKWGKSDNKSSRVVWFHPEVFGHVLRRLIQLTEILNFYSHENLSQQLPVHRFVHDSHRSVSRRCGTIAIRVA